MNCFYTSGGVQHGPMPWDGLLAAVNAGRLRPGDMVWCEGMPAWQPAETVPGLFVPMPPRVGPGGHPGGMRAEDVEAWKWIVPVGRSGWAIAAGYFGLFSLIAIGAPFAILTGILALNDIKKNSEKGGKGRAIFGLVMGVIFTLLYGFFILSALLSR